MPKVTQWDLGSWPRRGLHPRQCPLSAQAPPRPMAVCLLGPCQGKWKIPTLGEVQAASEGSRGRIGRHPAHSTQLVRGPLVSRLLRHLLEGPGLATCMVIAGATSLKCKLALQGRGPSLGPPRVTAGLIPS